MTWKISSKVMSSDDMEVPGCKEAGNRMNNGVQKGK